MGASLCMIQGTLHGISGVYQHMATESEIKQDAGDVEFWRDRDFSPLVNHEDLRKVTKDDPWQYEIASRLKNFLLRMESRNIVNFRVSGIVLHSASVLCRAKSDTMVTKGAEIQDALVSDNESESASEIVDDDVGTCTIDEIAFDGNGDIKAETLVSSNVDIDKVLDVIASGKGSLTRFLSHEKLERFNMPKRIVAKPVTIADLSTALNDALAGKFRRKVRENSSVKDVFLPDAITKSYGEELKIESLIPEIAAKVQETFEQSNEPVSFVMLFDDLSIIYIVKTFMAILHAINRKIVEAWQKTDGEILLVPFGKAKLFFDGQQSDTEAK